MENINNCNQQIQFTNILKTQNQFQNSIDKTLDIWYIKDNKRTKEINKKEIVDNQFRKNLRKGGTDRQKDNIVSFIKDVIYK